LSGRSHPDCRAATKPVSRSKVLNTLIHGIRPGGFIAWLDEITPPYRHQWPIRWEGLITISTSGAHRTRTLFIYRRTGGEAL
jgi:hypothetical protein